MTTTASNSGRPQLSATSKRRLLKLRELLLKDARKKNGVKFDLGSWAGLVDDPLYSPGKVLPVSSSYVMELPVDCRTHACAIGLACLSDAFKKAGLSYKIKNGEIRPTFGKYSHWSAVEKFFQIDSNTAIWLFGRHSYSESVGAVAERAVAARIKAFVDGRDQWRYHCD